MASAALSAAAHNVHPPYSIPLGPRIRPPRLLPGTKAENTNPQPDGPVPENSVWVQGKWRNPASNAAKDHQEIQSKRVEKALRHHTHGMNIYAYRQIRTNQVVYSLTRVMQNNKIMPQLVFHGKKTVPSSLRRDVWRPYFSIHFPQTPAGAESGLLVYRTLRELALKRQLSPPREMLMTTRQDVANSKRRHNPVNLHDRIKAHSIKDIPRLNQLLPPKLRAKKLMDQTASSVADAAFALSLVNIGKSPAERMAQIEQQRIEKHKERTPRDRRRVNQIRSAEEHKTEQIEARQQMLEPLAGQLGLAEHTAARIALEYGGAVVGKSSLSHLKDITQSQDKMVESIVPSVRTAIGEKKPEPFDVEKFTASFTRKWNREHQDETNKPPFPKQQLETEIKEAKKKVETQLATYRERAADIAKLIKADKTKVSDASRMVQVLWADMRDGVYAEGWSSNVFHGTIDPRAVLKREHNIVRQHATIDTDGHEIVEQNQQLLVQASTTPHVFGRDEEEKWYKPAVKQEEEMQESMKTKVEEWELTRRENIVKEILKLRAHTSDTETSDQLARKLAALEQRYPKYSQALDDLDTFGTLVAELHAAQKRVEELPSTRREPDVDSPLVVLTREQLTIIDGRDELEKEIRRDWESSYPGYKEIEKRRQDALADIRTLSESHQETMDATEIAEQEVQLRDQLEEINDTLQTVKIDLVLQRHQEELREVGDDKAAEDAAKTPRSAGQQPVQPSQVEAELQDMGVAGVNVQPPKGVWSRVKGIFGR